MQPIKFTVPAVPVAQPRQRHRIITSKKTGKAFAQNYTPTCDPVNAFKASVQLAASAVYQGAPIAGPVRIAMLCVFPRPKAMVWKTKPMPRVWCDKKPDFDNLGKSIADALTGTVLVDDASIVSAQVDKYVAAGDEQPHVEIEITPLGEEAK